MTSTASFFLGIILGVLVGSLGNGLSILLVFVDGPIKDIVVLEALTNEQITENLAEVGVVRFVIKAERPGVVQIDGELVGEPTAEDLSGSRHLLLHDAVILLFLSGSLESLPGERSTAEVEHDVSKRLHVIASRLFYISC